MYEDYLTEECTLTLYITFSDKCNDEPFYIPCKEAHDINLDIFWKTVLSAKRCGEIEENSVDCWTGFDEEEDEILQGGTREFYYQYNLIACNEGIWDDGDSDPNSPGDSYGWEPPGWIEEPDFIYLSQIDLDKLLKSLRELEYIGKFIEKVQIKGE